MRILNMREEDHLVVVGGNRRGIFRRADGGQFAFEDAGSLGPRPASLEDLERIAREDPRVIAWMNEQTGG